MAVLAAAMVLVTGCEGDNVFVVGADPAEDVTPPEVEILEPFGGENVPPDDSVLVQVAVRDQRGVVEVEMVGIALRGDPDLGTGQQVVRLVERVVTFPEPVRDTVLTRYLRTTDEPGSENVMLVVAASDAAGNVAADTVMIGVGGPRVAVRAPADGQVVRAGMQVPIQVAASDPDGVNLIAIEYAGVVNQTVQHVFAAVPDTVINVLLTLPATAGDLEITALARNTDGITNRTRTVRVTVASATDLDDEAPRVGLQVFAPERVELTDSIRIQVSARDEEGGTGVVRLGVTALATSLEGGADIVWHRVHTFDTPRSTLATHTFVVGIDSLYALLGAGFAADLSLPDTLQFEFHAIAVDAAGNCAAATGTALAQGPCGELTRAGATVPVAANAVGQRRDVVVVAGRTIRLPGGGVIADAVVDQNRRQLFLSNHTFNRVEKLDLQTLAFHPGGIAVGAQPWGLFMDNSGDSLIVANSGGTNLDFVNLNAAVLRAQPQNRIQTPNVLLYQINQEEDEGNVVRFTATPIGFSDRPQFVAQDMNGALLYSTLPTGSAPDGTVRRAWRQPDWDPGRYEVELLMTFTRPNPDAFALAKVDSVKECTIIGPVTFSGVIIYDRIPGTSTRISSGCQHPVDAWQDVLDQGSNAELLQRRAWDEDAIGMSDTTFVSASTDRRRIVFGEGAANTGRIIMWHAEAQRASNPIEVVDLIHNEPARITGIDLNGDGRLGVARGEAGAYFFSEDLRLYGRAVEGVGGGAGAAIHPTHSGTGPGLAFVGTNRRSIQVIDVVHYTARGEIPIRDDVVGPLRVSPRLPGDPADTVVRVYAVTSGGGVVLVRVRQSDITP
jgi:hypothetical protein